MNLAIGVRTADVMAMRSMGSGVGFGGEDHTPVASAMRPRAA
jgi:hypothetical protein